MSLNSNKLWKDSIKFLSKFKGCLVDGISHYKDKEEVEIQIDTDFNNPDIVLSEYNKFLSQNYSGFITQISVSHECYSGSYIPPSKNLTYSLSQFSSKVVIQDMNLTMQIESISGDSYLVCKWDNHHKLQYSFDRNSLILICTVLHFNRSVAIAGCGAYNKIKIASNIDTVNITLNYELANY